MNYKTEIIEKILNSSSWPDFKRSEFLSELDAYAEDAFLYDTVYGYLSSVLIYHQLTEEVILLVLENIKFFIQISIFPEEIKFLKKKERMFGELLRELEYSIEFEQKNDILRKTRELNRIRIQFVHKLTKQTSLDQVKSQAEKVKELFYEIFDLCQKANGYFYNHFSNLKKDIDWQEWLDDE